LLLCALIPVTAEAADQGAIDTSSSLPGVTIQVPQSGIRSPDGWDAPPLLAELVPQGPGVIMYRLGPAPGPWQPYLGPIIVPTGKQTLSAVLMGPDGVAGPVSTVTTRSDVHAIALTGEAGSIVTQEATGPGATVAAAVTVSVRIGRQYGTLVRRLGGEDRYDTSAILSAAQPSHGSYIIVATGQKFPDALTASGLAGCYNAPVILVTQGHIPSKSLAEIKRLRPKHAIICGGTPSVGTGVARQLKGMGMSVERLAGKTRYETAVAVSQRIEKLTHKKSRVFIARGDRFYDALVVAPLAFTTRTPILLTGTGTLWKSTGQRLSAARYGQATIIGGGIGTGAETAIRGRTPAVDRWSGADEYDTSVQVAALSVLSKAQSWGYVGIARGEIFPDALCGGVLAGKQGGVILLTPGGSLDSRVANALTAHAADVRHCELYGSNKAITDDVMAQIKAIFH
jgi:putative cell wall-binding protein